MKSKTMNPIHQDPSQPHPPPGDLVVFSYTTYIPIPTSSIPQIQPSNPYLTPDSIDDYSSSPSQTSFTKKDKQNYPRLSLKTILDTFLYSDISTDLPDFQEWLEWSKKVKGYVSSRVVISNKTPFLLVSTVEGGLDCYELPYTQGGFRSPILRKSFNPTHLSLLEQMSDCSNLTGIGSRFCRSCSACLANSTKGKVFVKKHAEIRRLERELEELGGLIRDSGLIGRLKNTQRSALKKHYNGLAKVFGRRITKLEKWVDDPQKHFDLKSAELERLELTRWQKELAGQSKLMRVPHWFISISCPMPLHIVFKAQDAWMTGRSLDHGRRVSNGFLGLIDHLNHLSGLDRQGFTQLARKVFRMLVEEAVEEAYPETELTMEHQMHPIGKFDDAPDVHFLVCEWGRDKMTGQVVRVQIDAEAVRRSLEQKLKIFSDFLTWVLKRWNGGFRATEFKEWRREVLKGIAEVKASGIHPATVDVVPVCVPELLGRHSYLRRMPMQNVKSLYFKKDTGVVDVGYHGGKKVTQGLIELLWRFVGYDCRGSGVRYSGAYRSGGGLSRDQKVDAMYREVEALRDMQVEMLRGSSSAILPMTDRSDDSVSIPAITTQRLVENRSEMKKSQKVTITQQIILSAGYNMLRGPKVFLETTMNE